METTFDHTAIYEENMRDCTMCHRHVMCSMEYRAIDGMEMLLASFLLLALDGKRRFILF
jgi:hypothetical protein